jgi:hypothetical protein
MTTPERSWADEPRTRSLPIHTGRTITMKQFTKSRVATVAVASGAAVAMASGVAYAVWSTTGTGAGTAKAATMTAAVVNAGTAPAGQLYPGLTANGSTAGGDLVVAASNPNPFPVTVTLTGGTFGGCTTPGVSIGSTASFNLAANAPTAQVTIQKVLSMAPTSSNDCQGATITITGLTTSTVSQ